MTIQELRELAERFRGCPSPENLEAAEALDAKARVLTWCGETGVIGLAMAGGYMLARDDVRAIVEGSSK